MGKLYGGLPGRYSAILAPTALGVMLAATGVAAAFTRPGDNGAAGAAATRSSATAIRSSVAESFFEKTAMTLASAPGVTVKEKGTAKGTFAGTVVGTFTTYTASKGGFKVTAYLSGGTLYAQGSTQIYVSGSSAYATGTAVITGGTGRFAHATSETLHYKGVTDRHNYHSTIELSGRLRLQA